MSVRLTNAWPLYRGLALICWLCVASLTVADDANVSSEEWPVAFREDANLFDVCFVDGQLGWAVGDRGTIWHTSDGGQNWELQDSPVGFRLESVHFVNATHGWAAGGYTVPYTHRAIGGILRTSDGGRTWAYEPQQFLPWLRGIHFSDERNGIAYGSGSPMYPSGVFVTRDGGQNWSARPGQSTGWLHADVDGRGNGWLLERSGRLSRTVNYEIVGTSAPTAETRHPQRLLHTSGRSWFLCGNQGLIQQSEDGGEDWRTPRDLPNSALTFEFDWMSIAASGEHVWVGGVPGTHLLHSPDGGRSWQWQSTGSTLPLYSIEFTDTRHGWAVGALGTILATADGGTTWSAQHGQGRRLGVLAVASQPQQIGWEIIAQLSGAEGYSLSLEVLSAVDQRRPPQGQTPLSTRLHEATVMLGGAGANVIQALPAPMLALQMSASDVRSSWDAATQANSVDQITEYLVRQVRMWQPDLVVFSDPEPHDGTTELARQAILQAVERAASSDDYPSQLQAGLPTWRVGNVTSVTSQESSRNYPITGNRLIMPLTKTVEQLAAVANARFERTPVGSQRTLGLRTMSGASHRSTLAVGSGQPGVTRRLEVDVPTDVRQRNQLAQRQRNLEAILHSERASDPSVWQQALHLAEELPSEQRGELLYLAAMDALRVGQTEMAQAMLKAVPDGTSPYSAYEAARLQRFWYLASQEGSMHAHRDASHNTQRVTQLGQDQTASQLRTASFERLQPGSVLPTAAFANPISEQDSVATLHHQQVRQVVEEIQSSRADLYFEPMLRFPLAAFERRTGQGDSALRFWRSQLSGKTDASFRSWAASEIAFNEHSNVIPKPTYTVALMSRPPRLDGKLDETSWAQLDALELQPPITSNSATGGRANRVGPVVPPTRVRAGRDAEFVYLGIEAQQASGLNYEPLTESRRRDMTLVGDRCEFCLDVDRDGVTYWRLAIDAQGRVNDSLNDDSSWNPQWFVATSADDTSWSAEIAIPVNELTTDELANDSVWGLGIQRIVPTVGCATWLQPAPVDARPEEFGYLLFR
ncbi:MAG: hypothetical protein KDB23_01235 [Planctomycetales bacterium]|nr:hypothetical protein [Planctomycetales bacterium]